MTPDPRSPHFIRNELPLDASREMKAFADKLHTIGILANDLKIPGINNDSFHLEYNTYDHSLRIIFEYIDCNEHKHSLTAILATCEDKDGTQSYVCDYHYLLKVDNFEEGRISVNSFAEDLMLKLWDYGIDAELTDLDWGLTFSSSLEALSSTMMSVIEKLAYNIKPMSWFYSDVPGWKFHNIYRQLNKMLPLLRNEAGINRWPAVKPNNFILHRDAHQSKIKLIYTQEGLYEMIFSIGTEENGFDPEISGEWMECEYYFNILTSEEEIKAYLETEHSQFCRIASTILDFINYKSLFAYGEDDKNFVIVVSSDWAFQKFCLLLDVMMPLRYRHKADKSLVTRAILDQKANIEKLLGSELEIMEDEDSRLVFNHGHFLEVEEPIHISYLGNCPF